MAAQARMMDSQTRMMETRMRLQETQQELASKDQIARLQEARELVIHSDKQKNENARVQAKEQGETQRLAMAQGHERATAHADRQHEVHMKLLDHAGGVAKAREGHIVGIHKSLGDRQHKTFLQGVAQNHEAQQSALDRSHQLTMQENEPEPTGVAGGAK